MLRLMDVESFKHNRALPPEEIRALFIAFEADVSSIGVRDAGGYARLWPAPVGGEGLDLGDIVSSERAHRVPDKGNKERLVYMLAGIWQRLRIWIDDVRGEREGPLFTSILRFDTLTNDKLTDQAVHHVLQMRQQVCASRPAPNVCDRHAG